MPDYDDLPAPQDTTASEPVTDSDEQREPTPQGRADDDSDTPEERG